LRVTITILIAALACAALGGCALGPPESQAQLADDSACTAQGDAVYSAATTDQQARTAQNGLLFGATPTHVFDAEQLGAEHERDSDISQCEQTGNASAPDGLAGATAPPPHIIATP